MTFQRGENGVLKHKKEFQSERMSVIWSLLRSDNCVGEKDTGMMMKGS